MKKKFSDLSVSKKTIILLLIFVLIPALLAGGIIINIFSERQIASEKNITAQKLKNTSDNLGSYFENIEDIAEELGYEACVNEIAAGEGAVSRYTDANKKFESIFRYNEHIVKVQILFGSEILWQYGYRPGYSFADDGNEFYANRIEQKEAYAIWTPGHVMKLLENGKFDKEIWFSSYYHGIYDKDDLILQGVLALHIEEESLYSVYQNSLEDIYSVSWILNEEGTVISSSDKSFFMEELPKELRIDRKKKVAGNIELTYQGDTVLVFWNKCGDTDNYLFQMRKLSGMKLNWEIYLLLVFLLFFLFCGGFLTVYNRYVLHPLRRLSGMIESTNDLNLRQEIEPVYGDEIGDLTKAYGDMMLRIDQLIQDVYVETIKTQEAEKEALLSQINPHFLYNTLDSIRWNAMMNGDREVGRQLEALSLMLRETLNFGNKYTTLEKEMSIIQNYCYLLQARFRKDIEIRIEMEPEDRVWEIPKLLIQPLVENAYKHGLEGKMGSKIIWVKIKRRHDRLIVYVADNGVGCNASEIRQKMEMSGKECFALRNVKERIAMEYGENGKFLFFSRSGRGTLVKLFFKLEV